MTAPAVGRFDDYIEPPTTLFSPAVDRDWESEFTTPSGPRARASEFARTTPMHAILDAQAIPQGVIPDTAPASTRMVDVPGRRSRKTAHPLARTAPGPAMPMYVNVPADDGRIGDITSLLRPGFELGNYVIGRRLAKGGMGVVYEGEHRFLHRKVAVKILRRSRLGKPELVRRFFHEAIAATRVGHPGVVEVIDYGHAPDGAAYLVMELLEGQSLAERLDDRRQLTVTEALDIGRAIADVMAAAHAAGIVHRDLKPDNIFLVPCEGPNTERVKVLDFGVAKFLQPADANRTNFGKLLGTPYYMSPEQCEGKIEVDHRSDIYSLGCLLFEMLTGRCPFAGHTVDVLMAHRRQEPPSVRHFNPNVPPEIELLIHQMLAKNPSSRLQSMSQVVAELTLAERSASGVEPPPERVPRFARGSAPPDLPSSMRMERFAPTVGSTTSRKPDYDPRARGPSILGKVMVMLTVIALLASVAATGYYAYITGWF